MRRGSLPGPVVAAVEVELVEDDGPSRAPAAVPRPPVHRHVSRALVATVVVAAVAVVGLNVGLASGERRRVEALAEVPGFLDPVRGPLERQWSLPGTRLVGTGDGVLLVASADHMLHGIDPATGDVRWTVGEARERGWCAALGARTSGSLMEHREGWTPDLHRAVCHSTTWDTVPGDDVLRRRTRVVSVDPTGGHRVAELVLTGRLVMVHAVDGDLVHVLAEDDGRVRVLRWDPTTGERRWDVRSEGVVAAAGGLGTVSVMGSPTLSVRGRGLLLVDVDSGRSPQDRRPRTDAETDAAVLADGTRVVVTDGRRTRTAVVGPDGRTRVSALGLPVLPRLPGGRDAVLVVRPDVEARAGQLRAFDVGTGGELWRTAAHGSASLLTQVGSVVVLAGPVRLDALDVRTGAPRWTVETLASVPSVPVTDGRLMLVAVPGDGGPDLAAIDVVHGHELWRTVLPDDTRALEPVGSGVVVETRGGVEGWG